MYVAFSKGGRMGRSELTKREELVVTQVQEKRFYDDIRGILLRVREQAYKNACNIMTQAY